MNENLFLRNPEETDLGRKIIQNGIKLIHQIGFESFTFKKLAKLIGTTEAGIYRYFENKQLLLIYIVDWYWSWQQFRITYYSNNCKTSREKLLKAIDILSEPVVDDVSTPYINEYLLYEIVMSEGAKAYLTRNVIKYNEAKLFKPYKDLCLTISNLITNCNSQYQYPRSLATNIIEMSHSLNFYKKNLPNLTDTNLVKDTDFITRFIEEMVFATIKPEV